MCSSARVSHSLQRLASVQARVLSPRPLRRLQKGGQAQAARKAWWQHRGLVDGGVDLAGCWAQKSTAHHLLMAELLEDAREHPSLHSHEQDGKTLPGCSACRDAVKAM